MMEVLKQRLSQLQTLAPDAMGAVLKLEALEADGEKREFLLRGSTDKWMRNMHGTLHGGICATIADQAMGTAAYCYIPGAGITPTIDLKVNYHRPLIPGENVLIRVRVIAVTKSLIHTAAELYRESQPEKICITAGATYFYKPAEQ